MAFAHAVVELVTNAYEHARPDTGDATVTVTAGLQDDGEAWLTVTDDGRWRERDRPGDEDYRRDQGYGLAMTASLAGQLHIDRGEAGTTVTFRRRLSRSARLLTADQISHGRAPAAEDEPGELVIAVQPDAPSSRIAIRGPLDASNAEDLGIELDRLTLGGSHELTVDLTAVTHLASAAVAELYRTIPGTETRRYPLRLYAPTGSVAHRVLSLVGLPHTTQDPHLHQDASPADAETG